MYGGMGIMDPYEILGASPIDSLETIKARYRHCILKYHPDRPSGNIEMYKMVVWAYKSIMDPENAGPNPEYTQDGKGRRSGHVKKQAAKYTRKNPKRKGRAARRTARQASRHQSSKAEQQIPCSQCNGQGYVEYKSGLLFRKTRRRDCMICDGKGTVTET